MGEQALFVKQLSLEAKRVFGGPGSREYELFRRKKTISLQNIDVGCALPAFSIFLEWPLRVGRPWGVLRNPRMVIRMGAYGFHGWSSAWEHMDFTNPSQLEPHHLFYRISYLKGPRSGKSFKHRSAF